ncbi:MAG: hypothetical protein H6557_14355 [Lewinellaceae bacterium]|nr:hypothetical protein [Lewinellaceae bacterium]
MNDWEYDQYIPEGFLQCLERPGEIKASRRTSWRDHRGTVAAGGVEELLWPEQSFAICLPTSGFASLPPTHLRPRQQVITSPRAAYEQLLIVGIVPIHLVFGEDAVDVLPFLREYSVQYHRQKRWFMK